VGKWGILQDFRMGAINLIQLTLIGCSYIMQPEGEEKGEPLKVTSNYYPKNVFWDFWDWGAKVPKNLKTPVEVWFPVF